MIRKTAASLEEKVYDELADAILSGKYKKGDALTEAALSSAFGASRTPVRSALHRLAEEGLVEVVPNRGAVVIGVTAEDLIDIYRIRMRLEGLASAIAAEKMSEESKKKLLENVELSEFYIAKKDCEHFKELDTDFHRIIYRATESRTLERILSDLHRNSKAYRKLSLTVPGRATKTAEEHKGILGAILSGDAKKAEELTFAHIEHALDNILIAMEHT